MIEFSKLNTNINLNEAKKELDFLFNENLNTINDKNKCSYTMPLNLQSILCILIAYEYKFSITTITALFQLYANDLIVIALTLLSSKNLENSFIEDSKQILEKLKTKQGNLSTRAESLFNLLKYAIFENKIYLPSDLW